MLKNTTKMANRSGLNLKFYPFETYVEGQDNEPVVLLDFANACNLELPSDMVWATGGIGKSRKVGFNNPFEGTLTISTQIITPQIRAIQSGQDPSCETTKVFTFTNNQNSRNRYYVIEADTVWKDTEGNIIAEHITVYKAMVNKNLTANYEGGDVDPQSLDIIFELAALDDGRVCKTEFIEEDGAAGASSAAAPLAGALIDKAKQSVQQDDVGELNNSLVYPPKSSLADDVSSTIASHEVHTPERKTKAAKVIKEEPHGEQS